MKEYKIYFGGNEFPASEYQCKIFDCIEHGAGNMVISAAAGSSKTTTIVNCTRFISPKKKIIFIAFNREIVKKLKQDVKHENAHMCTFHSLGNSILIENKIIGPNDDNINEYKYTNFIKENIDSLTKFGETKSLGRDRIVYINNIRKLSEYSRYYLAFSVKEIKKVADTYGIIPIRDEITVCKEVLKWGKEHVETIDYTDMIWLPNVLNLTTKKFLADWIFVDEAQDTSIMEQEMVMKCFKRGTRFVTVGDEFQQINIWCGASKDAIENFKKLPNTVEYKLPISYRCPNKIVELAKKYSDNIIAAPNAIDGEVKYDVSEYAPKNDDMVLCRTTAPLIKLHLKYLRGNKKSYIRGFEEIKSEYLLMINSTGSKMIDRNMLSTDGLFPSLYRALFKKMDLIKANNHLTDNEVYSHPEILKYYDNIEGISAISEGLTNVEELIEKINIIFNGDDDNAVKLSTIHKAKGLESDNVFILKPSLLPFPLASLDWEIETENNLIYVAYTRAKKTLNFIKEPERKFYDNSDSFSVNDMISTITKMKTLLGYAESIGTKEESIKNNSTGFRCNNLGTQTLKATANKISKQKKGGLKFSKLMDD